jgi:hypothetical protein
MLRESLTLVLYECTTVIALQTSLIYFAWMYAYAF